MFFCCFFNLVVSYIATRILHKRFVHHRNTIKALLYLISNTFFFLFFTETNRKCFWKCWFYSNRKATQNWDIQIKFIVLQKSISNCFRNGEVIHLFDFITTSKGIKLLEEVGVSRRTNDTNPKSGLLHIFISSISFLLMNLPSISSKNGQYSDVSC